VGWGGVVAGGFNGEMMHMETEAVTGNQKRIPLSLVGYEGRSGEGVEGREGGRFLLIVGELGELHISWRNDSLKRGKERRG